MARSSITGIRRLGVGGMLTKEFEFIRYNGDKLVLANARHFHTQESILNQSLQLQTYTTHPNPNPFFKQFQILLFFSFLQKRKKYISEKLQSAKKKKISVRSKEPEDTGSNLKKKKKKTKTKGHGSNV